ncbi:hypothetical protein BDB00DRAFT_453411 [Zychaea mexicana]|uniref:uncharacterized protein n=1 Tax=Zychaea mexicana TaxID=64656 RepID=UPI0022FDC20E|nr:uncharacterized protein BDB00DRAFT_453411 [Zychaea mexicana]KAI9492143.1 hypothetical protein BDB00DRAFT_453411 [Zychaea mexicana]
MHPYFFVLAGLDPDLLFHFPSSQRRSVLHISSLSLSLPPLRTCCARHSKSAKPIRTSLSKFGQSIVPRLPHRATRLRFKNSSLWQFREAWIRSSSSTHTSFICEPTWREHAETAEIFSVEKKACCKSMALPKTARNPFCCKLYSVDLLCRQHS